MKICTRDYSENNLLSTKEIDGVECCPNCQKPAVCHNTSLAYRALFWALSSDTGISSEALAAHMTGVRSNTQWGMQPPSDAADRGRCIRLLELIPEWIPRLKEMAQYDNQKPKGITISSSGISTYDNSWSKQIPMIISEGNL